VGVGLAGFIVLVDEGSEGTILAIELDSLSLEFPLRREKQPPQLFQVNVFVDGRSEVKAKDLSELIIGKDVVVNIAVSGFAALQVRKRKLEVPEVLGGHFQGVLLQERPIRVCELLLNFENESKGNSEVVFKVVGQLFLWRPLEGKEEQFEVGEQQ